MLLAKYGVFIHKVCSRALGQTGEIVRIHYTEITEHANESATTRSQIRQGPIR